VRKGFIYRFGVSVKEFGERMAHVRVCGVHPFIWCSGPVIGLGLAVVKVASGFPIGELR